MIDFNLPNPYSSNTKFFFLYSGGHGSFIACLLLKYWNVPTKYYFTDTFYEHPTLYKFLNQSLAILHDMEPLQDWCTEVPRLALWKERREYLTEEMTKLQEYYPNFIYDHAGISLWEFFEKSRYLANSRVDSCSKALKRKVKDKYLSNNISADTYIGVGIGIWEKHRLDKINSNSIKYRYHNPFVDCNEFENLYLEQLYDVYPQLEKPYLYTINAPHNNCFSGDTSFLTNNGWRTFEDSVGETVKVLGTGRNWVEGTIQEFGEQSLVSLKINRYGKSKVIRTTKDHIWFVWNGNRCSAYSEKPTSELKPGDRLVTQYPKGLASNVVFSTWGIAHGFTFGDGTVPINKKGWITPAWVRLCGEKDKAMLPFFNSSPHRVIKGGDIIVSGLPRHFKSYPDINESRAYLAGWLTGYFAADGSISKDGSTIRLCSANREHLEFAKNVADKIGFATGDITYSLRKGFHDEETPLYKLSFFRHSLDERFFLLHHHKARFLAKQEAENLSLSKPRSQGHKATTSWVVEEVLNTNTTEKVYCAVVPNGNKFTIDGYILTHNCSGMCIKAGLLQYKNLLEKNRDLYLEHEENEQELYRRVPTVKPFLRKKKDTQTYYISLQQYRVMLENNLDIGDFGDWGSCSCFL